MHSESNYWTSFAIRYNTRTISHPAEKMHTIRINADRSLENHLLLRKMKHVSQRTGESIKFKLRPSHQAL